MQNNITYGKHAVLLACKKRPNDITKILLSDPTQTQIIPKELHKKIEIQKPQILDKIGNNHNGFICYTKPIQAIHENDLHQMQKIIALDGLQDVGNIGAIIRTAAALNVEAIIYTNDKMPNLLTHQTIAKFSSGGVELVKLCPVVNISRTLQNLQKEDFWIIGADANGQNLKDIKQKFQNNKKVVVLGSEESGMKTNVQNACDAIASIPINKDIESLNVSVAAGIILWELFGI